MGTDALNWEDDWQAWVFLRDRGYTMHKGRINFRPEKVGYMPEDESRAIDYLVGEWDWAYE